VPGGKRYRRNYAGNETNFQFSECYIIVSIGGLEKLPPFAYIKTK